MQAYCFRFYFLFVAVFILAKMVPQLQFDFGYMDDGGALQIACFIVGTDTIFATMVSDSKKIDMP